MSSSVISLSPTSTVPPSSHSVLPTTQLCACQQHDRAAAPPDARPRADAQATPHPPKARAHLRADACLWPRHVFGAEVQAVGCRRVEDLAHDAAQLVEPVRLAHHVAPEACLDLDRRPVDGAAGVLARCQQRRHGRRQPRRRRGRRGGGGGGGGGGRTGAPACLRLPLRGRRRAVLLLLLLLLLGRRLAGGRRPYLRGVPAPRVQVEGVEVVVELAGQVQAALRDALRRARVRGAGTSGGGAQGGTRPFSLRPG